MFLWKAIHWTKKCIGNTKAILKYTLRDCKKHIKNTPIINMLRFKTDRSKWKWTLNVIRTQIARKLDMHTTLYIINLTNLFLFSYNYKTIFVEKKKRTLELVKAFSIHLQPVEVLKFEIACCYSKFVTFILFIQFNLIQFTKSKCSLV